MRRGIATITRVGIALSLPRLAEYFKGTAPRDLSNCPRFGVVLDETSLSDES